MTKLRKKKQAKEWTEGIGMGKQEVKMDGHVMDLGDDLIPVPVDLVKEDKTTQVNCTAQMPDEPANDIKSENASSSMVLLHEIEEFIHKMQLSTEETILR